MSTIARVTGEHVWLSTKCWGRHDFPRSLMSNEASQSALQLCKKWNQMGIHLVSILDMTNWI